MLKNEDNLSDVQGVMKKDSCSCGLQLIGFVIMQDCQATFL